MVRLPHDLLSSHSIAWRKRRLGMICVAQKEVNDIRLQSTKSRSFIVEGMRDEARSTSVWLSVPVLVQPHTLG